MIVEKIIENLTHSTMDIKQEDQIDDKMDEQVLIKQESGVSIDADLYKHPCEVKIENLEQYHLNTTSVSSLIKSEKEVIEVKYERLEPDEAKSEKPEPLTSELEMVDSEQCDQSTNTVRSMVKSEEETVVKIEKMEPEEYMDMAEFIDASQLTDELDVKSEYDPDAEVASDAKVTSETKKRTRTKKQLTRKSRNPTNLNKTEKNTRTSQPCETWNPIDPKSHPVVREESERVMLSCYHCKFNTDSKTLLIDHMNVHKKSYICTVCNATFAKKLPLDNHTIRYHPDLIATVTSKVHACTKCEFKTTLKGDLAAHLVAHFQSHMKPRICVHCSETFRDRLSLDNHIIKFHPELIASVTSKVYECKMCIYKTTKKRDLIVHKTLFHCEATPHTGVLLTCVHCNAKFRKKITLNDHIAKKHPDAIESVIANAAEKECPRDLRRLDKRNLLYCYYCKFTAYSKSSLISHIAIHRNHALKLFKRKTTLDNHVIGNHSNLTLVDTKVHDSTKCSNDSNTCVHCDATFVRRVDLDDHIKRHHPEFPLSVTSKIHQCTSCTYKTTNKACFNKHKLTHMPPRACKHCNAKFSRTVLLDNHIIKKHPNFTDTVTSKLYECTKCTYKTVRQRSFATHIIKHPETIHSNILSTCEHCYETFASKISLETHIVKNHPEFIQSVTSKLYECTKCTYKTVRKGSLATHKLTHPETASSDMFKSCVYCNALFKSKPALDNHVLRKHPNFVTSVTTKVYECTSCSYKAIKKRDFTRHVKTHPVITSSDTAFPCMTPSRFECLHCDATFVDKFLLDDHVIKKHPDYMASVTSLVHECKECTYKTTRKSNLTMHMLRHTGYECKECHYRTTKKDSLANHMLLHLETADSRKHKTCRHCNSVFKSKRALDNHILKKHPDFIDSVTNTVYKCSDCTYQCTKKRDITLHIRKHSDTTTTYLQCVHCNSVPFSDQLSLDNHIIKRHPNFITSVTSEIYGCIKCTFKTVRKKNLTAHMLRHREITS